MLIKAQIHVICLQGKTLNALNAFFNLGPMQINPMNFSLFVHLFNPDDMSFKVYEWPNVEFASLMFRIFEEHVMICNAHTPLGQKGS
jgi:hypothetical protein